MVMPVAALARTIPAIERVTSDALVSNNRDSRIPEITVTPTPPQCNPQCFARAEAHGQNKLSASPTRGQGGCKKHERFTGSVAKSQRTRRNARAEREERAI